MMSPPSSASSLSVPSPPPSPDNVEAPWHPWNDGWEEPIERYPSPDLQRHPIAARQVGTVDLWAAEISPDSLTITMDRTSSEPLLYVKIDLFNLRPLDQRVNFPMPPGVPHASVAGRMRIPIWQDFWRLKHRMMT